MLRSVLSFVILCLFAFTAPVASATPTDAQFQALMRQVNGLRIANQRLEAQVAELKKKTEEAEQFRPWLDRAKEFVRFTLAVNGTYSMQVDTMLSANQGAFITGAGPALEVQGNILAGRRYWNKPAKFYLDGDFDATGHGGFNIETSTPTFIGEQGVHANSIVAEHYHYEKEGFTVDLFSEIVNIRELFQTLGIEFSIAKINSPAWVFQSWIKTVLGQWKHKESCQPGYSACNDGDPCTDNWCDPQTSQCEQALIAQCQ